MSTRFLSVDLGNSRCKLRIWSRENERAPCIVESTDFDTDLELGARVRAWLREKDVGAAGISSVASPTIESDLVRALEANRVPSIDARPDPGLSIACREPDRVGRDRLFAARGALERVHASAIVVDAGTALTVDALRVDARTRRGEFVGGAIAPGPRLLSCALSRETARLPRIEPQPGARALGQDTESALQSGVVVGFEGAARELVLRVAAEALISDSPVLLTGGARAFLVASSTFARGLRVIEEPELVALGILAAHTANSSVCARDP